MGFGGLTVSRASRFFLDGDDFRVAEGGRVAFSWCGDI